MTDDNGFKLYNTKRFFQVLVCLYFLMPAFVSDLVFDNQFYIYSASQVAGNIYSIVFGLLLLVWIRLLLPSNSIAPNARLLAIARSSLFSMIYFIFLIYLVCLALYGAKIHAAGASREELLGGMDNFLLPGMSYLLLCAAISALVAESNRRLALMAVLFILIDVAYNGKIFSFLAVALIFFRMDYVNCSKKIRARVWTSILVIGPTLLFLTGLSRKLLAGEELDLEFASMIYTIASEFLGVQASIGWAIDYYQSADIANILSFASAFQDSYLGEIGHGLAISPIAFFVGNFGNFGGALMVLSLLLIAGFVAFFRRAISWIIFLIIALNFQHFLRHGFDVFISKIIAQSIFFYIVYILLPDSQSDAAREHKTVSPPPMQPAAGNV